MNPRHQDMFKSWLLGGVPKVVATEYGNARSLVSEVLRNALDLLGSNCLPLNAPLQLSVRARAEAEGVGMRPFTYPLRTLGFLPPAEAHVAQLILEGRTQPEMAAIRGKTVRTISNQSTSVFRKFKVGGVSEFKAEIAKRIVADWR